MRTAVALLGLDGWPKVWPKLSSARSPRSSGRVPRSRPCVRNCRRSQGSVRLRRRPAAPRVRVPAIEEACIADRAVFDTSASPARSSRAEGCAGGRVGEHRARRMERADRFLLGDIHRGLAPTEESTIDSRVVGSCRKSTPRIQHAATNPAGRRHAAAQAKTQASRVAPGWPAPRWPQRNSPGSWKPRPRAARGPDQQVRARCMQGFAHRGGIQGCDRESLTSIHAGREHVASAAPSANTPGPITIGKGVAGHFDDARSCTHAARSLAPVAGQQVGEGGGRRSRRQAVGISIRSATSHTGFADCGQVAQHLFAVATLQQRSGGRVPGA